MVTSNWKLERQFRTQEAKTPIFWDRGLLIRKVLGDDLLSHARCTLPLAQDRFTSEFGMGSGGTKPLWSPSKGLKVKRGQLIECT
jgi:hypothetical protein